jgi:hypothetical protein
MSNKLWAGLKRLWPKEDKGLNTLKSDGIPWNIKPVPSRIIAIGDVHGDITGLSCILFQLNLIDRRGHWKGNRTHLILNGDLVGGKNARLLVQFVIRLEKEALTSGGAVHPLLGNHDIQVLFKKYQNHKGKTLFQKYRVTGAKKRTIKDSFSGCTAFALWLQERNAVIKIGPTIFSHAGLNTWAFHHHPERINATIRAWIRFWQGVDVQPNPKTQWVAFGPKEVWFPQSTGPLWTRSYKVAGDTDPKTNSANGPTAPDLKDVTKLLNKYNAHRMVIGHSPVADNTVQLSHPYYGKTVVMIDSRISQKRGGRLSCVEIQGNDIKAHYAKRNGVGEKIKELELKRLKKMEKTRK